MIVDQWCQNSKMVLMRVIMGIHGSDLWYLQVLPTDAHRSKVVVFFENS